MVPSIARHCRNLALAAGFMLLASCHGGGMPPVPGHKGPAGSTTLSITIPGSGTRAQSAARRGAQTRYVRPSYVSENAKSLTIAVNGQTFTFGLTATSNGCSQPGGAGTAVSCTLTLSPPVGTYPWTFTLWSSTGGTGNNLAIDTQSETISATQANIVRVTLNGVVGSYAFFYTGQSLHLDDPAQQNGDIVLSVLDPSGATIITPGNYVDSSGNPVTFALSDNQPAGTAYNTYGYTLSTTSIGSPNQSNGGYFKESNSVTLGYKGISEPSVTFAAQDSSHIQPAGSTFSMSASEGAFSATITCNASGDTCVNGTGGPAGGGTAGSATFTTGGDTATIAFTEPGWIDSPYSQSVSVTAGHCSGGADGVTLSGASPTWTLTANAGTATGTCSVTFTDGTGRILVVNASFTKTAVIIQ